MFVICFFFFLANQIVEKPAKQWGKDIESSWFFAEDPRTPPREIS